MFIRLFRSESSLQAIILLLLGISLWIKAFIHPVPMPAAQGIAPFYDSIRHSLSGIPWLVSLIGLILLFSEAILLNLILNSHDLCPRNSLLPAIIYVLLMSWSPAILTLNPVLIANALLIFLIYTFFKVYEQPDDAFKEIFSTTFTLALASFFNLPAAALLIIIWFGLIIYRVLTWREWAVSIIGFSIPYLFIATWYFWFDRLPEWLSRHANWLKSIRLMDFHFNWIIASIGILFGIFILLSVVRTVDVMQEKVISIRKKLLIIIWFVVASLPAVIFSGEEFIYQMSTTFVPATVLIAFYFNMIKKMLWPEILFTAFIVGIILLRIY